MIKVSHISKTGEIQAVRNDKPVVVNGGVTGYEEFDVKIKYEVREYDDDHTTIVITNGGITGYEEFNVKYLIRFVSSFLNNAPMSVTMLAYTCSPRTTVTTRTAGTALIGSLDFPTRLIGVPCSFAIGTWVLFRSCNRFICATVLA
jgi:hypothetical protein